MQATAPRTAGRRGGDVVGVAGRGRAEHLAVDAGAAGQRRLALLEHERRRRPPPGRSRRAPCRTGRLSPDGDSARMIEKAAVLVGVMSDSAPPASTRSQRPSATSRAPAPIEWVPAAQAVVIVSHGPCSPKRSDSAAAPAFGMTIGMVNGDTRFGPALGEHADLRLEGAHAAHAGAQVDTGAGRGRRAGRRRGRPSPSARRRPPAG